jgi:heparan-alpha-glucosaminide N-acetyltransferase
MVEPKVTGLPLRLTSIDAYRGLVMLLMMGEVLSFCRVAQALEDSWFWKQLCFHQDHVEWIGCSLHDLIQPSFSFLVGVALPFSLAARAARGQSRGTMAAHAVWRSLLLVALGVFLRSTRRDQTNFTFEDTLSQIGLGYTFLFLLGLRPVRDQVIAVAVILVGYWAAFALTPLPDASFDYRAVGVPESWPHLMEGFAGHWNKNSNLAWRFDAWFLNLFPRSEPFVHNGGGYATLSFIPTLGTMILGLLAGGVLKSAAPSGGKVLRLVVAGAACLAAGYVLGRTGICPVVKRIWTPSWVLYSGGWCYLLMAGFYAAVDLAGHPGLAYPLRVVGRNSIAAYCLAGLTEGFVSKNLTTHLGAAPFRVLGPAYEPLLHGAGVLAVLWLVLYWMDKRGIYLRI